MTSVEMWKHKQISRIEERGNNFSNEVNPLRFTEGEEDVNVLDRKSKIYRQKRDVRLSVSLKSIELPYLTSSDG